MTEPTTVTYPVWQKPMRDALKKRQIIKAENERIQQEKAHKQKQEDDARWAKHLKHVLSLLSMEAEPKCARVKVGEYTFKLTSFKTQPQKQPPMFQPTEAINKQFTTPEYTDPHYVTFRLFVSKQTTNERGEEFDTSEQLFIDKKAYESDWSNELANLAIFFDRIDKELKRQLSEAEARHQSQLKWEAEQQLIDQEESSETTQEITPIILSESETQLIQMLRKMIYEGAEQLNYY